VSATSTVQVCVTLDKDMPIYHSCPKENILAKRATDYKTTTKGISSNRTLLNEIAIETIFVASWCLELAQ
jgi:hypothetical protein